MAPRSRSTNPSHYVSPVLAVLGLLRFLAVEPLAGGSAELPGARQVHFPRLAGLRLRGGAAEAAASATAAPGTIRVPTDVEDLDEAIEMIPGAGDTIEFDGRRHVMEEAAIVRWGMRMRLRGACNTREHRPLVAERSAVWGNWTLLQRTMGEWRHLNLALHCYTSQSRLLDVRGGPWVFEHCDTRCIGGVAMEVVLRGKVVMTHCGMGGIDALYMRAQDALVCRMDSCADLANCTLEMCGVITGHGVQLLEEARAHLDNCTIRDATLGATAEGNSCLALGNCTLVDNRWAPLYCGPTARKVTVCLDSCTLVARCGFIWLTNRRPAILRTRSLIVHHTGPDEPDVQQREGRTEDYNAHPKFHAALTKRRYERARLRILFMCGTCI